MKKNFSPEVWPELWPEVSRFSDWFRRQTPNESGDYAPTISFRCLKTNDRKRKIEIEFENFFDNLKNDKFTYDDRQLNFYFINFFI